MDIFILSIVVLIYLLMVGYVGYIAWRRTKSSEDYMVAGRDTHPYIMALSYGATFISTAAIVGFGGVAANYGMGILWLVFLNIIIGIFIAFVFFGKRTRKMGHNLGALTFPEFVSRRFNSKFIQYFSGAVIFLGMPLYASVVLIGMARFVETTLQIDYNFALVGMALIVAVYVIFGGIRGVMYTDALQGTIMFFGMIFLLGAVYWMLGGVVDANQALTNLVNVVPQSATAKAVATGFTGWTSMPALGSPFWWTLVSSLILGVGIGVLSQPQLVVRFMTVKSNRELNRAVLMGGVFIFVMTFSAYVVGALSNLYFFQTTGQTAVQAAGGNLDKVIPVFIAAAMPLWFAYLFMITLLSAAMSTLSAQFHVQGTALGRDIYETLANKTGRIICNGCKGRNSNCSDHSSDTRIHTACKYNSSWNFYMVRYYSCSFPFNVRCSTLLEKSYQRRCNCRACFGIACKSFLVAIRFQEISRGSWNIPGFNR